MAPRACLNSQSQVSLRGASHAPRMGSWRSCQFSRIRRPCACSSGASNTSCPFLYLLAWDAGRKPPLSMPRPPTTSQKTGKQAHKMLRTYIPVLRGLLFVGGLLFPLTSVIASPAISPHSETLQSIRTQVMMKGAIFFLNQIIFFPRID